uniref:Aminotransferase class I/classII large domain-containing protein n=1 Tax=Cyclopterus lumpus TaxID=8103 RepID=A0A8C3B212_CYCLU
MTTVATSVSSSSSQPPSEAPATQAVSTQATVKSTPPTSVKACERSQNVLATLRGAEPLGHSVYLSNRGNSIRQNQGILQESYAQYAMDKHHGTENPDGIINMATSENKLCYDLLHKRLTKPDMLYISPSLLQYSDWRAHTFLREEVAKFLTHYCRSPKPLKADNVVVMNGCSSLFSCIAAVICDPKDVILIPTPFYGTQNGRPFHLTVGKLEEGLKRAKQQVIPVILMNPHNPLAEIYTPEEMIAFLEFAKRNELHSIVDEVYMLTVFDEHVVFHSVLSVDSLPDAQRTHVMWGMSKDFAMAGTRLGTLYTENNDLLEAMAQLGSFHGISGTTQHQVAQLLKDREWISEDFLPENRCKLKAAHSYLTGELQSIGVPYLDRPASLYVWADFREYLRESTFEEELSLWRRFLRHKVVLSCGQAFFCSTPGWFRIVFSDQHLHLQLGQSVVSKNTPELSAGEDPEILDVFKALLQSARK